MASSFDTDFSAANAFMAEIFGTTITVQRGGRSIVDVTAEPAINEFYVENGDGYAIRHEARDYVVAVTDYDFGTGAEKPKRGDRFYETVAGVEHVYEALPMPGGVPVFQPADIDGEYWLIHTQRRKRGD